MNTVTADFIVETKNGIAVNIGRNTIPVPETNFSGGSVKWYEDKPKKVDK